MALNVDTLVQQMLSAGASAFGDNWARASAYAAAEFRQIAQTIAGIESDLAQVPPAYTPEAAKLLFGMQLSSLQNTLIAEAQLIEIAVQAAIKAVLESVSGVVQQALGFDLFAPV
ncbi:hypothetical protein [Azospirillum rugosum]|uniref:Proteins of 100 residues with WXG n=1 Tax=Azospirillum rugosum TaxID=416170 RepID=A0ABS4SWH7_9PROT|nr:hypothetical protein [Azospirillum rugosum]MBP2296913.1 hypothetical protein [Azospirillum rugosum]MDQ0530672.1 hypothetical protein [Azospirillum rugosum]